VPHDEPHDQLKNSRVQTRFDKVCTVAVVQEIAAAEGWLKESHLMERPVSRVARKVEDENDHLAAREDRASLPASTARATALSTEQSVSSEG
jgi:hypothetical protein